MARWLKAKNPMYLSDSVELLPETIYILWIGLKTSFSCLWANLLALTVFHFNAHFGGKKHLATFIKACNIECFRLRATMLSEAYLNRQMNFLGRLLYMLFSDIMAITLTSYAFVASPIHEALLNKNPKKQERLTNNGNEIIGFFPVSISDFNVHRDHVIVTSVDQGSYFHLLTLE